MRVRFPGLAVEDKTRPDVTCQRQILAEVGSESLPPLRIGQKCVSRELRNVDPVVEDQVGLDASITKE